MRRKQLQQTADITHQTWAILLKVTLTLTFWGYWHWQLTLNWWLLNNWHWHWHWCWSIIMTQHWHWHWGQKNIDIDIDIEGLFEKNNWHWHWTLSVLHRSVRKGFYWCWISMLCKELFVSSHFLRRQTHMSRWPFFQKKSPTLSSITQGCLERLTHRCYFCNQQDGDIIIQLSLIFQRRKYPRQIRGCP